MHPIKELNILLVEDNDDHATLITESLKLKKVCNKVERASDGIEALEKIKAQSDIPKNEKIDIVLLDINIPKINGLEVLKQVRSWPQFNYLPILILTTSSAESDLVSAYDNHANSYLVKPFEFKNLLTMAETIGTYWGNWNTVPRE